MESVHSARPASSRPTRSAMPIGIGLSGSSMTPIAPGTVPWSNGLRSGPTLVKYLTAPSSSAGSAGERPDRDDEPDHDRDQQHDFEGSESQSFQVEGVVIESRNPWSSTQLDCDRVPDAESLLHHMGQPPQHPAEPEQVQADRARATPRPGQHYLV